MNAFRLAGDMLHVLSILVLIMRLSITKNAIGISIKTQQLYLLVFITRYLDLFFTFYSFYNSIMKVLYIVSTSYVIYMVYFTEPFKTNYEKSHDSFLHWYFAVIPCLLLAIITVVIQGFDVLEVSGAGVLRGVAVVFGVCVLVLVVVFVFSSFSSVSNTTSSSPPHFLLFVSYFGPSQFISKH